MTSAAEIEARAAAWVARSDALGPAADAQLTAWLLADPRHRAAYLRLAEAWGRTERLARLRPRSEAIDPDLLAPTRRRPSAWTLPRIRRSAVAAAAAASIVGLLAWWGFAGHGITQVYRTGPAGLSRVALPDGTVATLNAHTELHIRFRGELREVHLVRGEAEFNVVHDKRRPFQVSADGRTVRDVGTVFDVRRDDAQTVEVFVRRGRVAVLPPGSPGGEPQTLPVLRADDVAVLTGHTVAVRHASPQEIGRQLHWERRMLVFQGETLRQAAAEFNRFNYRKIIIADPALGQLRIGGEFRALAIRSFVAALGHSFNIAAEPGLNHTIVLYSPAR